MISNTRFWSNWTEKQRRILFIASLPVVISLGWFGWASIMYPAPALSWGNTLTEEVIEIPIEAITVGPYQLEVKADSYLLWSGSEASGLMLPKWPWYLFAGLFTCSIILLLTVHSTLTRWWFYGMGGLVPILLSLLRPEAFGLPIPYPWPTVLISLIWLGPGLYFHLWSKDSSIGNRFIVVGLVVSISLSSLMWLSSEPEPVLLLCVGYLPAALFAFLAFLILTGHEILAGLIRILGTSGSRHSLRDFLILSLIYIANLVATYFGNRGWIDWDFPIHPLLLLLCSGILSFWGVRNAHEQTRKIFGQESEAVLTMMALFLAAFSAIGLMYATMNDAVITTARNLSLYVHIGFGVMFVPYILINFGELLVKNLQVRRVLYQPRVLGMLFFRLSGLLTVSVFIFYHIWKRPVNDLRGGYYNAIGDYYSITGQQRFSDAYLEMGRSFAFHNQHSNYLLASRALEDRQLRRAITLLDDAAERRPMPEAYVNGARQLISQDRLLDAYARLETALSRLPGNEHLHNTMGLVELGMDSPDSALWNFSRSGKISGSINTAATLARFPGLNFGQNLIDSLQAAFPEAPDAFHSNLQALGTVRKSAIELPLRWPSDTTLTLASATFLNNYLISHSDSIPEESLLRIWEIAKRPSNSGYAESLHFALAHAAFRNGMPGTAFEIMDRVVIFSNNKGRYNNQLAIWALNLGAPVEAVKFSNLAMSQNYPDAAITQAIALSESGDLDGSRTAWQNLAKDPREAIRQLAEMSLRFLSAPSATAEGLSDVERYSWCRYHQEQIDDIEFEKAVELINDGDLRVRAILDRSSWQYRRGMTDQAIHTYQMVRGLPILSETLYHDLQLLELRLLAWSGDLQSLSDQLKPSSGFRFSFKEKAEQKYFEALINEKDTTTARQNFEWITEHNLWFDDGVIRSVEIQSIRNPDFIKNSSILARALHLNPGSIRIRKKYILDCYLAGQYQLADIALGGLRPLISEDEWAGFLSGLPERPIE